MIITIIVGNAAIMATDWILYILLLLINSAIGSTINTIAQKPRIVLLGSSSINKCLYEYLEITIVIESNTVEYKPIIAKAKRIKAMRYWGKVSISLMATWA